MGRGRSCRRPRAVHEDLCPLLRSARAVPDGIPAAACGWRVPLGVRQRRAALRAGWRLRRLYRLVHRHYRSQTYPGGGPGAAEAGERRAPRGRNRPRLQQPAGRHSGARGGGPVGPGEQRDSGSGVESHPRSGDPRRGHRPPVDDLRRSGEPGTRAGGYLARGRRDGGAAAGGHFEARDAAGQPGLGSSPRFGPTPRNSSNW